MLKNIFKLSIQPVIILFFLTSNSVAEDKVKFEKKMKSQYKQYTKKIEWTNDNTFTSTLNQNFSKAQLKSTVDKSCKLAKKYKLQDITIQIKSTSGKLLLDKTC